MANSQTKITDVDEIQCYVAASPDNSQMFAVAVTLEQLVENIKDRFDLDDEEFAEFKQQHQIEARPIKGVPVKNIVEIQHRAVLASQETMQNLIYDSYELRDKIDLIQNYESMAEVVANAINSQEKVTKPTPQDALAILKSELDYANIRQPSYPLNQRTGSDDKNYLMFADGSRLDMRSNTLIAEANVNERIEKLQKEYRHKFAQELTSDVKMYREPDYELSAGMRMRRT